MFTIKELMTRNLITLEEDDPLELADEQLEHGHIRHLPVVRRGKLVGLLTHRDLLRNRHRQHLFTRKPVTAKDVMVRNVLAVRPDSSVRDAICLMLDHKIGCLPVTDEGGALLGILTDSDLLRVADQRAEDRDRVDLAAEFND